MREVKRAAAPRPRPREPPRGAIVRPQEAARDAVGSPTRSTYTGARRPAWFSATSGAPDATGRCPTRPSAGSATSWANLRGPGGGQMPPRGGEPRIRAPTRARQGAGALRGGPGVGGRQRGGLGGGGPSERGAGSQRSSRWPAGARGGLGAHASLAPARGRRTSPRPPGWKFRYDPQIRPQSPRLPPLQPRPRPGPGPTVQRHELAHGRRAASAVLHELHLGHDDVVLEHRAAAGAHGVAARRIQLDVSTAAAAAHAARHAGGSAGPGPPLRPLGPPLRPPRRCARAQTLARLLPPPHPPIRSGRFVAPSATAAPAGRRETLGPRRRRHDSNPRPRSPSAATVQTPRTSRPPGGATASGGAEPGCERGP